MLRILVLFEYAFLIASCLRHKRSSEDIFEDSKLHVPQLVRKYGYPLEEHRVTTYDGYILTMHRIPYGKENSDPDSDRPVVFVMHGLLSSSADFVVMGPGDGLGYILADEGFDVWLANARGNRYSRAHISLNPNSNSGFWKFSWDEVGSIDVPALIDYVLEKTEKEKLHYIGHSQGTTSFFVMSALRPRYNDKIISFHALAPVAYMGKSTCPLIRAVARLSTHLDKLFHLIGFGEFFPNSVVMRWAGERWCRDRVKSQIICSNIVFLVGGFNPSQHNATMLPAIMGHSPAGASVRQFAHYGQSMYKKGFQRFHYGWLKNLVVYGTLRPPSYNLANVKAPAYFHYSKFDPFAHVDDVERLWNEIGNPMEKIVIPMDTFSHFDFLYGIDVKKLVYDKVIEIMKNYSMDDENISEMENEMRRNSVMGFSRGYNQTKLKKSKKFEGWGNLGPKYESPEK